VAPAPFVTLSEPGSIWMPSSASELAVKCAMTASWL
jgi:hypothetical protein